MGEQFWPLLQAALENQFIQYLFGIIGILLCLQLWLTVRSSRFLSSLAYKLETKGFKDDDFLQKISEEYLQAGGLLDSQQYVQTAFTKQYKWILRSINFLEISDAVYLFLGFLAAFLLLFFPLLELDLSNLLDFDDFLTRADVLGANLKLAIWGIAIGGGCALLSNIVNKIFRFKKKLNDLFRKMAYYLEKSLLLTKIEAEKNQLAILKEIKRVMAEHKSTSEKLLQANEELIKLLLEIKAELNVFEAAEQAAASKE